VAYTEVKEKSGTKYYYRACSVRNGNRVGKERIYLGKDLNKKALVNAEKEADAELGDLNALLLPSELKQLARIKKEYSKQPAQSLKNRYECFITDFTHDSTAIEGNTLTLRETAMLLFENMAPQKNIREINEVLNHKEGIDHILEYEGDVTRKFILELHRLVVKGALEKRLDDQIGQYRTLQVYISGTDWMPPSPEEVPKDMKNLLSWYTRNKNKVHPVVVAVYFHVCFEIVHPFVDGNGRVGRLLMNFILHKNGYPMVNIPNSQKKRYYSALEKAQNDGDLRMLLEWTVELLGEGFF
jgi:Fic family protein